MGTSHEIVSQWQQMYWTFSVMLTIINVGFSICVGHGLSRFGHKNNLVRFRVKISNSLRLQDLCHYSYNNKDTDEVVVRPWSKETMMAIGFKQEMNSALPCQQNQVLCFVDPSIHPNLLPMWTLSLLIQRHQTSSFTPIINAITIGGRLPILHKHWP